MLFCRARKLKPAAGLYTANTPPPEMPDVSKSRLQLLEPTNTPAQLHPPVTVNAQFEIAAAVTSFCVCTPYSKDVAVKPVTLNEVPFGASATRHPLELPPVTDT